MKIVDIQNLPTLVEAIPDGCRGVHESTLRAFHILERVKHWLRRGVPSDVILELVAEMEDHPPWTSAAESFKAALEVQP